MFNSYLNVCLEGWMVVPVVGNPAPQWITFPVIHGSSKNTTIWVNDVIFHVHLNLAAIKGDDFPNPKP
jgi:hypothetical protein